MEKEVRRIELIFENGEWVVLESEDFEWFYLSCTDQTISGRGGSIRKNLWTSNVHFTLKENVPEVKDHALNSDEILFEWLEDHSLYGRIKYGDITQIYITTDDGETEVYYIDGYDEVEEFGPNNNQKCREVDGKLEVTIESE